jgi:hypothetical protein
MSDNGEIWSSFYKEKMKNYVSEKEIDPPLGAGPGRTKYCGRRSMNNFIIIDRKPLDLILVSVKILV